METSQYPKLKLEKVYLYGSLPDKKQGYPILQDISFEIFKGEKVAIVGYPGAGKTLLLRLINRLSTPSKGRIFWDGQEYSRVPVILLRKQIVLMPQESKLLGMTVQEALDYPLILRNLPPQVIAQRVRKWREKLQISDEWLTLRETQLSSGQRQLIAIARVLAIEPQILLLDEPTSSLDFTTANLVLRALKWISQNYQTTIVMVNHRLDLVEGFCDRLLHLHEGCLILNRTKDMVNWQKLNQNIHNAASKKDDFDF